MALFVVIFYSIIKYGSCLIKLALFNCCVYILVFRRLCLIPQMLECLETPIIMEMWDKFLKYHLSYCSKLITSSTNTLLRIFG